MSLRLQPIDRVYLLARASKLFSRSLKVTGAIQRIPLSAVQFTFVNWPATTSAFTSAPTIAWTSAGLSIALVILTLLARRRWRRIPAAR